MLNFPLVSIIIISHNCRNYTFQCLNSLLFYSGLIGEIIVVDNCSTDGTVEMIREKFESVKIIANDENKGYAYAVNVGVTNAQGNFVIITNADVVIDQKAIDLLIEASALWPIF
ncbi:glycosyltransferase family 2 protein [Thermanaeromonas sp. C210]|uniref:glycosyltransferase family 2 protein n=1 Tax=Thermanaeromonas sp. C210 TaxID=2731925 RepID=UPI00155BA1C6|nr:glycosyltransferase [Thermanaeromonas sp. C210]GFN23662.1 hypothetical protein TAMC210_19790 [Thermanaeromonas sp. C210]